MTQFNRRSLFVTAVLGLLAVGASPRAGTAQQSLKQETEGLLASMVAAFKADPSSVAKFYADDATIVGGGQRASGRAEIDRYWAGATVFVDWTLEVTEVGGEGASPWARRPLQTRAPCQGRYALSGSTVFTGRSASHG